MKNIILTSLAVIVALLSLSWIASSQEQKSAMTFFITSVGSGRVRISAAWRPPIVMPSARASSLRRQPHLARLFEHQCSRRQAGH